MALRMACMVAVVGVMMAGFAMGAEGGKGAATRPADYLIGEMHVQTLPAITYLYGSGQTTLEEIAKTVEQLLPGLLKSVEEGKTHGAGGPLFIYVGMEDMSKPFTLQVGMPVKEGTQGFGEYKVRKLGEYKCATVLLTGSVAHLGEAYEKLMGAMEKAKLTPAGESRESYLYWEGAESANNVVQIQMGIK